MKTTREPLRWGTWACPRSFVVLFVLAAMLVPCGVSQTVAQQPYQIAFPVPIQWNKQKGVSKYRLQIASDERFQDVFFDGRVAGNRYVANTLSPGYYYWRVASADSQPGSFSRPQRFFVSGGVVKTLKLPNRAAR